MTLKAGKVKYFSGADAPVGSSEGRSTLPTRASAPLLTADTAEVFASWILSPAYRAGMVGEGEAPHCHAVLPLAVSARAGLQGVIFDLDGVLVDTATFHYRAWKQLAGELGLAFDERMNQGFRGVGRMECLDKLLGEHARFFAMEEKEILADRKNGYYLELVKGLRPGDLAAGAGRLLAALREAGVRVAVASASKNARLVLGRLGIEGWFEALVDGTEARGKKESFLRAAERMRVAAEGCVVVEDAQAGVEGAREAGMKCVGVGEVEGDVCVGAVGEVGMGMLEGMVVGKSKG